MAPQAKNLPPPAPLASIYMTLTDLPQYDDTVLCAPVGGDVKHARAVAADDPVVHLRVVTDVGVQGPDHPHHRTGLQGLRDPELVQSCRDRAASLVCPG